MALSNLEGCTIGGLDEGRGHNTRIFAVRCVVTLDVSELAIHSVDMDGTVTTTQADGSGVAAMTVQQGSGFMMEIPAVTNDNGLLGGNIELTFGVTGTAAPTPTAEQFTIGTCVANCFLTDANGDDLPVAVAMQSTSGNQVVLTLGDLMDATSDIDVADSDTLTFNIIAFGIPA